MFMGDFIAVMNKGKILQFDTPVNIYNKPNSAFVARFFGETLSLRSKVNNRKVKTIFGPIKVTDSKSIKAKEIEIIFRSEAFSITKNNHKKIQGKIKSKIIAVKYISENSYLHLDILSNSVQKHIHIKVPGKFIPPKNKKYRTDVTEEFKEEIYNDKYKKKNKEILKIEKELKKLKKK